MFCDTSISYGIQIPVSIKNTEWYTATPSWEVGAELCGLQSL